MVMWPSTVWLMGWFRIVAKGFLLLGGCLGSTNWGNAPRDEKNLEVGASLLLMLNIFM